MSGAKHRTGLTVEKSSSKFYGIPNTHEPQPCFGCDHESVCRDEELACDAFAGWCSNGRVAGQSRMPSRAVFERKFC